MKLGNSKKPSENNKQNEKTLHKSIITNVMINQFPKVVQAQKNLRMELIKQNKILKENLSKNVIKYDSQPNITNEIFLNKSITESYNSNYINLNESTFIPRGIYVYPYKDNYRPEESYEVKHMVKLDNYNQLEELLEQTADKLQKEFNDFPHNRGSDERIDNVYYVIWIFLESLKEFIKREENINIVEIITKISELLKKKFRVVYKVISKFINSHLKSKAKEKRNENISTITTMRKHYCQICFEYMCLNHFYNHYKVDKINYAFIYEQIFEKDLGTPKYIYKKNENSDMNSVIIDLNSQSNCEESVYEYTCDKSELKNLKTKCRYDTQKIKMEVDETDFYRFVQQKNKINYTIYDEKDLYIIRYLISSEICTNSCYISKFIFNNIYQCYELNKIIQNNLKNNFLHLNEYLKSKNNLYPGSSEEKLQIIIEDPNTAIIKNNKPFIRNRGGENIAYVPCSHIGPCTKENCNCVINKGNCEKFCNCGINCQIKWQGCVCIDGCGVREEDYKCPCVKNNRECDPDTCNCNTNFHAKNKEEYKNISKYKNICTNMSINYQTRKKTCLAKSVLSDFYGLFAFEDIKKDEFICDYLGEIFGKDESERRSVFMDKLGYNYLFTVDDKIDIDAFRAGNEMRYVNHSSFGYQNCYARTCYVRGVTRIPLYARRDITKGEELYFDYNFKTHVPWLSKYNRKYSK